MRRKGGQGVDFDTIARIIGKCNVLRPGLADGDCPYIVPVNFAHTVRGGWIAFYIRGAMAGKI